MITFWRRYQGMRVQIFPGKNDNDFQEDIIYVGKHRFLHAKSVMFFPCRLHIDFQEGILKTTSWISGEHIQEVTLILKDYIVFKTHKV